ncbi:hypothetical protein [Dactylosporangium darangshiense]|uniref:Uncharacterized protein n=1 Tax=Dactylosporangium darangshiense TaxID=579108 RepID=A0ABP8DUS0_9ACTN
MTSGERIVARLGRALVIVVLGSAIGYVGQNPPGPGVTSWVDAVAVATKHEWHAENPPVGDLVVLPPASRTGLEQGDRIWTVLWLSAEGKLCGIFVDYAPKAQRRLPSHAGGFRLNEFPDAPDLAGIRSVWNGYLWMLAKVPPEVVSVTLVSDAGATATAQMVKVSTGAGAPVAFFVVTLYAADRSLGAVHLKATDASGRVVFTKTTDEVGM